MRSEGFSFYFGGLGVEMCSLDASLVSAAVCNRPQLLATVRNRLLATVVRVKWPCLWRVPQKYFFGSFKCRVASFRAAGVALCDIPICFISSRKSFCVADAILQFSRQAQRFGDLHRHFAWQAMAGAAHQTYRVACFL